MSSSPTRLHLVQLAGGQGLRVGGDIPKQFRDTGQGPLFAVSLANFLKLPDEVAKVVSVTVTASADWAETLDLAAQAQISSGLDFWRAEPGKTRTESTWHGLQFVADYHHPEPGDLVAVHDAARPFASTDLLRKLVAGAQQSGAAVPGVTVADTILETDPATNTAHYLDRANLVAVQTPQVFRWDLLFAAHQWASRNQRTFTDDGSLVAHQGTLPAVVDGDHANWKVTTDGDWRRARDLLA